MPVQKFEGGRNNGFPNGVFYQPRCEYCRTQGAVTGSKEKAEADMNKHNASQKHKNNLRNKPKLSMGRNANRFGGSGADVSRGKTKNPNLGKESF